MKFTAREIAACRSRLGIFGEQERRSAPFAVERAEPSGSGNGRLHVIGHAAVFNQPSVAMASPFGAFTEYIAPGAFDDILSRNPDVLLTWDHDTSLVLARVSAGTLELSIDSRGLRFWASCSDTTYSRDLAVLMTDAVVNQASFLFSIAPGGEEWSVAEGSDGTDVVTRRITRVGELYDVCVAAMGAYPQTDSGVARSLALDYAMARGYLNHDPATATRKARALAELELRRRRAAAA